MTNEQIIKRLEVLNKALQEQDLEKLDYLIHDWKQTLIHPKFIKEFSCGLTLLGIEQDDIDIYLIFDFSNAEYIVSVDDLDDVEGYYLSMGDSKYYDSVQAHLEENWEEISKFVKDYINE